MDMIEALKASFLMVGRVSLLCALGGIVNCVLAPFTIHTR